MEHLAKRKPRQGQIDQSREWIFQSLLELLGKQRFSDITFSQLASRSGLSRQTIHRHFTDGEAILLWHMDQVFAEFFRHIKQQPDLRKRDTILANTSLAVGICRENSPFLAVLISHNLAHLFLGKVEEFVHIIFTAGQGQNPATDSQNLFREKYFAGGFYLVIVNWIKRGMVDSVSELQTVLGGLISF